MTRRQRTTSRRVRKRRIAATIARLYWSQHDSRGVNGNAVLIDMVAKAVGGTRAHAMNLLHEVGYL